MSEITYVSEADVHILLKTQKPYLFASKLPYITINDSLICHILQYNYVGALKILIIHDMNNGGSLRFVNLLHCITITIQHVISMYPNERVIMPEMAINLCLVYAVHLLDNVLLKPQYSLEQYKSLYVLLSTHGNYTGLLLLDKYMVITKCEEYIGQLCSDVKITKAVYMWYLGTNDIRCLLHILVHASNKSLYHLHIINKHFNTTPTLQLELQYVKTNCMVAIN